MNIIPGEKIGYIYDEMGEHSGYYCGEKIPKKTFVEKIRSLEKSLDVNEDDRTCFEGLRVSYIDFTNSSTGQTTSYTVIFWKTSSRGII